jgi:hypothetical protein
MGLDEEDAVPGGAPLACPAGRLSHESRTITEARRVACEETSARGSTRPTVADARACAGVTQQFLAGDAVGTPRSSPPAGEAPAGVR